MSTHDTQNYTCRDSLLLSRTKYDIHFSPGNDSGEYGFIKIAGDFK